MRVAYICMDPGVPVFGDKGCSIHVQEIIRAFKNRGDEVELFAARFGSDPPSDLRDIPCHRIGPTERQPASEKERGLVELNPRLSASLTQHAPFDLVYERYSLFSAAAMEWAEAHNQPGILEVNAPLIEEQTTHRTLVHRDLAYRFSDRSLQKAGTVVAVSQSIADYLAQQAGVGHKTVVVSNGVNLQRFSSSDEISTTSPREVVIGFVGTLKPWHGIDQLLAAFNQLHQKRSGVRLRLVGDGPRREALRRQLATYPANVQNAVDWMGRLSPEAVPAALASCHIGVAPYPKLDNFYFSPLKIFEYMACGLPVVASQTGQITEIVDHRINGLLYPPGNHQELTNVLEELCDQEELRRSLGAAGRSKVEQCYSWDSVLARILESVSPQVAI